MPIIGNEILLKSGGYEPQRTNNWILSFTGLSSLGLDQDEFYLSLKSFPFPEEANARKIVRWFNESRSYAGSVEDFENQNLVIRDYIDKDTLKKIYDWRRLVWNPKNLTIGFARNYKCDGVLYLCRSNAIAIPDLSRKMYLQGCWPRRVSASELDMDAEGDQMLVTVEIVIDRAYPSKDEGTSSDAESMKGSPLTPGTI